MQDQFQVFLFKDGAIDFVEEAVDEKMGDNPASKRTHSPFLARSSLRRSGVEYMAPISRVGKRIH